MADGWKWLWLEAGRSRVSHFLIRTSNSAELENRQVKGAGGPILDGRACSDPVVVIKGRGWTPYRPRVYPAFLCYGSGCQDRSRYGW